MPFKLAKYSLQYGFTGLLISSITVLGFTYFLMMPGGSGDLLANFQDTTAQIMAISHLIMPLVILIGLSFGFGLLHNHSEIVLVLQLTSGRQALALMIIAFAALTLASEATLWPSLESDSSLAESTRWQQSGSYYLTEDNVTVINEQNGQITGFKMGDYLYGNIDFRPNAVFDTAPKNTSLDQLARLFESDTTLKQQYSGWQQVHQIIWPLPLFFVLWAKLKQISRGSTAAGVAGSVAIYSIALGLTAEALFIVLSKSLVAPWLTALAPLTVVSFFSLIRLK